MIRLTGSYRIDWGTFEELDAVSDAVMSTLLLDDTIISPDVMVSMDTHRFEAEMLVDTDDPVVAAQMGANAMARALMAARVTPPAKSTIYAHQDLVRPQAVKVEAELVDA